MPRDNEKELADLKARIVRLEHAIIFGAPMTVAEDMAFEALRNGDKETFKLYQEQDRRQRAARAAGA
jgi:hypothetical protein